MPHVSRSGRPTEEPEKMVPDEIRQRSQPQPPRVRCRARPFFWPRGRGFLARSDETGTLRAQRGSTQGAVKNVRGLGDHTAAGHKARPQFRTRLRGRDGARRGHESASGRPAAEKQVAPSFSRSGTLGASCRRPAAPSEPVFWRHSLEANATEGHAIRWDLRTPIRGDPHVSSRDQGRA